MASHAKETSTLLTIFIHQQPDPSNFGNPNLLNFFRRPEGDTLQGLNTASAISEYTIDIMPLSVLAIY